MHLSIGSIFSLISLAHLVPAKGQVYGDCSMPPFICQAIPKSELAWASPEWRIVGSYHDIIYAYGRAMEILKILKSDGSQSASNHSEVELTHPNVTTWKISNWPEKLEPKYLVLMKDAKRIELTDGELEDITGPYDEPILHPHPGDVSGSSASVLALQRVPEAEVFSFSNNKIKEIKADTFKYNTKLREIYLDHNEIVTISPSAFNHLQSLEKLVLLDNKLTQVPHGLPSNLIYLDLKNNLCGQTASADVIVPEKLSYLNLCGNYLQNSTIFRRVSFTNLNTLCIGDKGPQLPFSSFKNSSILLQNLTLSAKRNEYALLTDQTARDLKKFTELVEFNLDYYKVKDVNFIVPLDKLEVLRLHNVALLQNLHPDKVKMMLKNKRNLKVLSLDGSPDLVDIMKPFFLCLSSLSAISLQQTGLLTIAPENFADGVVHSLRLDISYNPLNCEGGLDWIHSEMDNSSTKFTLETSNSTYCTQPHLVRLLDFQMMVAAKANMNAAKDNELNSAGYKYKDIKKFFIVGDIAAICIGVVVSLAFTVYWYKRRRPHLIDTEGLVNNEATTYSTATQETSSSNQQETVTSAEI